MKFLLDANFVLAPVQFKVDVYEKLGEFGKPELFVLDLVRAELVRLGKDGTLALKLLDSHPHTILPAEGVTDDALVAHALNGYIVCTMDTGLIARIHAKKQRVVRLRNKSTLILD